MLRDLRLGMRSLLQAKAWTAVIIISLALGIGANTALFSAVNGLLLRRVPVKEPDNLVRLRYAGRNDMASSSSDYGFSGKDALGRDIRATFSYPMYQQFLKDNRTLADLFAGAPIGQVNVVANGQADVARAFISTGNYYQLLGVQARMGRTLLPEDDVPGAPPVAVISHGLWRSRFGSDPGIVGKVVQANNLAVTIVGVLPPEFTGVQQAASEGHEIAFPLALDPQLNRDREGTRLSQPTNWWLHVIGRLKPGVAAEQVRANLEGVFRHTARAGMDSYLGSLPPDKRSTMVNRNRTEVPHLIVDSANRGVYEARSAEVTAVAILSAVVALVLLIVCANVANMLLSRAAARHKELSVRLSLGATRMRLIRQLLTESLILAGMGGILGIAVGYWGRSLLPGPPGRVLPIDWRVMLFVFAITAATGIVFGIAPALRATGVNVSTALKEGSRGIAGSRSVLGKSLLVVQVAISLVLLVGAGLFLRTLENLRNVDVGFNPHGVAVFRVSPGLNGYDVPRTRTLFEQMITRIRSAPGVQSVALSHMGLLAGGMSSTAIYVPGRSYQPGDRGNGIHRLIISPGFFETMEMRLLLGRPFNGRDHDAAPKVAIINDTAARKYFPNENPIGRRFGNSVETTSEFEIVGVLRDAAYDSVRDAVPPTMYVPYTQARVSSAIFEVRTAGDPLNAIGTLRQAVKEIDSTLPLTDVSTQSEQIERRLLQEKLFARAYVLFGGLALSIASVGLFGLMSYSVSRRTNEIGVRMALGAQRGDVLRLVMNESMALVLVGIVVGVAVALAAGRLVSVHLFGLSPTDAGTMAIAGLVMMSVAAFAGYLPARRAARVDPLVALRDE
jgi:predicted permease